MLRILSNFLAVIFLAMALITAVLDLTKSIADSKMIMTPLGQVWRDFHVASLSNLEVGIARHLGMPWLWENMFVNILLMPAWLVFVILAGIFFWFGRKSKTNWRKRFGT